mmetsp:Transcript_63111/g.150777  ORF Transcript_63111/g.150777 Transcript_63111/m.150777 type:complete len:280 (-) Transcript_63111:2054-2893(-)
MDAVSGPFQQPGDVDGQMLLRIAIRKDLFANHALGVLQVLILSVQDLLVLRGSLDVGQHLRIQPAQAVLGVAVLVLEGVLELPVVVSHYLQSLILDPKPVHAILSIKELDNVIAGIPSCAIIGHLQCLHRLHKTPLDVPCLGGLAGRVDDPLAASHGMHPDFLWCKACQVGVLHEAPRLRSIIVLREVRQGPLIEAVPDAGTFHVLLTHTGHNLGNVQWRPLRASIHHGNDVVALIQRTGTNVSGVLAGGVQTLVRLGFERLVHGFSRLRLQLSALSIS